MERIFSEWIAEQPHLHAQQWREAVHLSIFNSNHTYSNLIFASLQLLNLGFKIQNTAIRKAVTETLAENSRKSKEHHPYLDDVRHIISVYR